MNAYHYQFFLQVMHRHKSGQRKTRTVSFTIHCYDVRVVKLTFITDVDGEELSDSKSSEFLTSTSSCQTEKGVGGGGGGGETAAPERTRIAQVLKDFAYDVATQSPKFIRGVTEKVKGVGGVGGGTNAVDSEKPKSEVRKQYCGQNLH